MNSIIQKLSRISMIYLRMMYNLSSKSTKEDITLLKCRALSIFFGWEDLRDVHLWVMAEKMIFIWGNCRWRSCKSCLIPATSFTLLMVPRSFPPQWTNRTSGTALPRRHWWKKERRFLHATPAKPPDLGIQTKVGPDGLPRMFFPTADVAVPNNVYFGSRWL